MSEQVGELNLAGGRNKFRYSSFKERIENLSFDVLHQIDRKPIDIENSGSFFNELFESLLISNLTVPFEEFSTKIKPLVKSLPQILHHKKQIAEIIKEYLYKETSDTLIPVLQLIPCLARDLQEEFYNEFLGLLDPLIIVLNHKEAGIIEHTFNAIAFSLKYLSKIAIKKLPEIFKVLAPLMGERRGKAYLRVFVAESFGFLIRRCKDEDLKEIIEVIFEYYDKNREDEILDGLSLLLLESVKNIDNKLHSRYSEIQDQMFLVVQQSQFSLDGNSIELSNSAYELNCKFIKEACNYCRKPNATPINEKLIQQFSSLSKFYGNQKINIEKQSSNEICIILGTIKTFFDHFNGACVQNYIPFLDVIVQFVKVLLETQKIEELHSLCLAELFSLLSLLVCQIDTKELYSKGKVIINYLYNYKNPIYAVKFSKLLIHLKFQHFSQLIIPPLIKMASEPWEDNATLFVMLLTEIIDNDLIIYYENSITNTVTKEGLIQFTSDSNINLITKFIEPTNDWDLLFDEVIQFYNNEIEIEPMISMLSCYLSVLANIKVNDSNIINILENLFDSLSTYLIQCKQQEIEEKKLSYINIFGELVLGQIIYCIFKISCIVLKDNELENNESERPNKKMKRSKLNVNVIEEDIKGLKLIKYLISFWNNKLLPVILPKFQSKNVLKSIHIILSYLKQHQIHNEIKQIFENEQLNKVYQLLTPSLICYDSNVRLACFEILSQFEVKGENENKQNSIHDLFQLCIQVDSKPTNLNEYRDKLIPLRKLSVMASNGLFSNFDLIVPSLCVSMFTVNFRPLWLDAIKGLQACSKYKPKVVSKLLLSVIEGLQNGESINSYNQINNVFNSIKSFNEDKQNLRINQMTTRILSKEGKENYSFDLLTNHLIQLLNPRNDRLDHWVIYEWILRTFIESPHLAEAHSTTICKLFLQIYEKYLKGSGNPKAIEEEEEEEIIEEIEIENNKNEVNIKKTKNHIIESQPLRKQLIQYLEIFSKFQKADKLKQRNQLEPIFETLLASGDSDIQTLSLKCIETYRYQFISEYSLRLHNILNDIKFRDEITTFSIAPDSDVIESKHREQLLPYLVKILYGRLISRKGRKSSKMNINHRRTVILSYLSALAPKELSLLFNILFKPFNSIILDVNETKQDNEEFVINKEIDMASIPLKNQLGFLYLLSDILKQLGTSLNIYIHQIIAILIHIMNYADQNLMKENSQNIFKEIRQQGLKRLLTIFNLKIQYNFQPYMKAIFDSMISSKLNNLPQENSQGPSATLDIILTWSTRLDYYEFLVDYDDRLLTKLFDCLSVSHVKSSVTSLVIDVVENLFKLAETETKVLNDKDLLSSSQILAKTLRPNISSFLDNLEKEIISPSTAPGPLRNNLFQRQIRLLSKIAPYIDNQNQAKALLNLLYPSLHKPNKVLDEFMKRDIIIILSELVKLDSDLKSITPEFLKLYQSLARLFFSINLRESRQGLLNIFLTFSKVDKELKEIIDILNDINAFSKKRLDEPDYDVRLNAFTKFNDEIAEQLNAHQWLPLLYNFLYFLKNEDEMSLRNSGSFALTKYFTITSQCQDKQKQNEFIDLLSHIILPSIKKGLKINSETIRYEYFQILGQAVKFFPTIEPFNELVELLGSSNKEDIEEREEEIDQSNFFNGIYHIQLAQRVKVLTKFSALLNKHQNDLISPIRSSLLSNIFLPICSDFIFSDKNNELTYEAIRAISAISRHLSWSFYISLFRRYFSLLIKKPEKEKLFLKIIFGILDGFRFNLNKVQTNIKHKINEDIQQINEEDNDISEDELINQLKKNDSNEAIHKMVITYMIPDLLRYLNKCPEDKIADRIPLALVIARLLKKLPQQSFKKQIPSLILNMCNLLKSRDQTCRDNVRNVLIKIAQLFGPPHLHFIIKELYNSLNRGFFKHILSYTVNSILVALTPALKNDEIDKSASLIMDIIIEDLFGEVSKEKEAEDYTGKQKEVKSRKGNLSLDILTTLINFKSLPTLLIPLKQILSETDNGKTLIKVSDALTRISSGLIKNSKFDTNVLLKFCHGLIMQNIALCQVEKVDNKKKKSNQEVTYTVHIKRKAINGQLDYFSNNAHKFVEFGMELLLSALKRNRFEFENEEIKIQMLNPFIDIMGESLYSNYQSITVNAIKIIQLLLKIPLPGFQLGLPTIIKRIFDIIISLGSTQSEVVQTGFKLIAYVIKNRPEIEIKDQHLTLLINLIMPDLEEPSRQSTTFLLIRAILSRQLLISSLYDLIDEVGKIMVTNQLDSVRNTCREVYLQFLMDYPQGSQRLDSQIQFLISNLSYEFETGRESIMELFNALFIRISPKLLNDYSETIFLALIMVLINDDSIKCREMAAVLIKTLITKLDNNLLNKISQLVIKWASIEIKSIEQSNNNVQLKRIGLQTLGLMVDSLNIKFDKYLDETLIILSNSLDLGIQLLLEAQQKQQLIQEKNPGFDLSHLDIPTRWEIPYNTINTLTKVFQVFKKLNNNNLFLKLNEYLLHPHNWLRISSSRLLGMFYANCDAEKCQIITPVTMNHPLLSIEELFNTAYNLCIQIKSPIFDNELADQWVKNLYFIGQVFYFYKKKQNSNQENEEDEENESELESDNESINDNDNSIIKRKMNKITAKDPLGWLLKRCSYIARLEVVKIDNQPNKIHIFKLFAALVSVISTEDLTPYLIPILSPIIRTLNDPVLKEHESSHQELMELTNEVEGFIKHQADSMEYLKAINKIQENIRKVRRNRKEKSALQALNQPEAFAKSKLRKTMQKKKNSKQKIQRQKENSGKRVSKKKEKSGLLNLL
ncbi:hypothetical protein K502DRAFT_364846 [Neoconidiobolus thromboides FSU 785]|nr:hypothetical protein K502DRAFT_364846 [Neoconidiobolus thromboides FSU 785]